MYRFGVQTLFDLVEIDLTEALFILRKAGLSREHLVQSVCIVD